MAEEPRRVKLQPYKVISIPLIGRKVLVPDETFQNHEGIQKYSDAIRQHRTAFKDSQAGLTHSVPTMHLDQARAIDPDLEVLGGFNS